ncbi:hypothetical protein C8Q72DRAFT_857352 [Fomitopsis betulina]|nr:hypothetical protein C8Q72DRAFT_857352 [Fomitopsis betulina]
MSLRAIAVNTSPSTVTGCILLLSCLIFAIIVDSERRRKGLPPGPRGLPFIGNILQLSSTDQHKQFAQWGAQYGQWTRSCGWRFPSSRNLHGAGIA